MGSSKGGAFGSLSARFLCSSMNIPTFGSCPGPIVMTGSANSGKKMRASDRNKISRPIMANDEMGLGKVRFSFPYLHINGGILHCVSSGIGPIGICSGVMSYAVISSSPPPSSS
uniref:Uncharacterized protein n=1 Tax=Anopheles farauti TaxID=69004 RepID=A0A182QFZ6_9DIPT